MFFKKKKQPRLTITLPEPCSEEWTKMRVVDNCHRHCEACERTLTDFAQMNDDELLLFFKHSDGNVCGWFRKDQLNRPLTPLPEKTSKASWWKAAALLPLTLFSKNSSAQQLPADSVKQEQEAPGITLASGDSIQTETVVNPRPYVWSIDSVPLIYPEVIQMGGVPMIHWEFEFPQFYITMSPAITDTIVVVPQKTDSALGVQAAASPSPVKKSKAPGSAGAAWNFKAIVPDSDENK